MKIGKIIFSILMIMLFHTTSQALPYVYSVSGEAYYDVFNTNGPTLGKIWGHMIIDDTPDTDIIGSTATFNILELDVHLDDQYAFKGFGTLEHNVLNTDLRLTGTNGDWTDWDVSDDIGYLGDELLESYSWVEQFILVPQNYIFMQNLKVTRPIPEPTTMILIASGLIGLMGFKRKLSR